MSPRRKVPDAETAQAWLAAVQQSGLTPVEWCAEAGVDARSLQCWRLALAKRGARPALQFVEVVPRAGRGAAPAPVPPPLRVHLRDVVVEVAAGFDADTLAKVLRVVRAC
jgi:hypothetical protein